MTCSIWYIQRDPFVDLCFKIETNILHISGSSLKISTNIIPYSFWETKYKSLFFQKKEIMFNISQYNGVFFNWSKPYKLLKALLSLAKIFVSVYNFASDFFSYMIQFKRFHHTCDSVVIFNWWWVGDAGVQLLISSDKKGYIFKMLKSAITLSLLWASALSIPISKWDKIMKNTWLNCWQNSYCLYHSWKRLLGLAV